VAAFADEVEIEIGEEEWKSVRVEEFEGIAGVGAALNFVAAGFWADWKAKPLRTGLRDEALRRRQFLPEK